MAKSVADVKIKREGEAPTFKQSHVKSMARVIGKCTRGGSQLLLEPSDASVL